MKILFVNKYLYPRAGAELYMINLAKLLYSKGYELAFFGMEHPENIDLGEVRTFPFLDLGLHSSNKLSTAASMVKSLLLSNQEKELVDFVNKIKPDIIHAHNVYNQMSPGIFKAFIGKYPILMTVHDYKIVCPSYNLFTRGKPCERCLDGSFFNCSWNRCVQKSFLKSSLAAASSQYHKFMGTYHKGYDFYVAPSEFMKKTLVRGGIAEERIRVVHNFVINPGVELYGGEGFVYAGRITAEKGVDTLIEAYALLKEPRPKLKIFGEGPLLNILKEVAISRGLNKIEWLGKYPPEKLQGELLKASCSIVPSLWSENCSMSILESFALGRPVIGTSQGGNSELIIPGVNGMLFEAGNSELLAANMEQMMDQKFVLGMQKRTREHYLKHFEQEGHLEKVLGVYHQLLKKE